MANKNVETPEIENLGAEALTKTEQFFENNGKRVAIAIFALLALAAVVLGYKMVVVEPKEVRAADAIYGAQMIFESNTPDYQLALDGDDTLEGFLYVIENFGSTKSGNLASHYAGICYLKLGDNTNALRYLKQYKAQSGIPAQIINAQNIALQGDIAVDNGDYAGAVALFKKAANISENPLTTPMFLRKAGVAAIAAGDNAEAKALLQSVKDLYPSSAEARTADKYLGSIK